jgi:hypothetical protein
VSAMRASVDRSGRGPAAGMCGVQGGGLAGGGPMATARCHGESGEARPSLTAALHAIHVAGISPYFNGCPAIR